VTISFVSLPMPWNAAPKNPPAVSEVTKELVRAPIAVTPPSFKLVSSAVTFASRASMRNTQGEGDKKVNDAVEVTCCALAKETLLVNARNTRRRARVW